MERIFLNLALLREAQGGTMVDMFDANTQKEQVLKKIKNDCTDFRCEVYMLGHGSRSEICDNR